MKQIRKNLLKLFISALDLYQINEKQENEQNDLLNNTYDIVYIKNNKMFYTYFIDQQNYNIYFLSLCSAEIDEYGIRDIFIINPKKKLYFNFYVRNVMPDPPIKDRKVNREFRKILEQFSYKKVKYLCEICDMNTPEISKNEKCIYKLKMLITKDPKDVMCDYYEFLHNSPESFWDYVEDIYDELKERFKRIIKDAYERPPIIHFIPWIDEDEIIQILKKDYPDVIIPKNLNIYEMLNEDDYQFINQIVNDNIVMYLDILDRELHYKEDSLCFKEANKYSADVFLWNQYIDEENPTLLDVKKASILKLLSKKINKEIEIEYSHAVADVIAYKINIVTYKPKIKKGGDKK